VHRHAHRGGRLAHRVQGVALIPTDPTTIDAKALLELVQCPPVRGGDWYPKEQASPSALQDFAACNRRWGETYLNGRREPRITWEYASQIPEPAKPPKGCSALAKAEAQAARKAWNKVRRPALGHEVHAILGAWMIQNVPGCWHPPMPWREIDWMSFAGKIARPACDVLPDPRGLVAVYTELSAEVEAPDEWRCDHTGELVIDRATGDETCGDCGAVNGAARPWPRMPGFYDLITVERVDRPPPYYVGHVYRLWDFKSTSSFDWAKTTDELAEDPQVLLYALHAMQTFGLQEIECNWLYLCTEGKPKAYLVTVVITRAQAEAATIELAHTAAEVVSKVQLFRAGRLRVIDLSRNISACPAYGGCVYHTDKGGPCDAKTSPGKAVQQRAELDAKIKARKSERKENETNMAMDFAARKAARDAKTGAAPAGTDEGKASGTAPADGEGAAAAGSADTGGGGAVSADESAKASTATAKARTRAATVKASEAAGPDSIIVVCNAHEFTVPAGSSLGKQLSKLSKAHAAVAAALAGE
jgi:hypothetical protein